MGQSDQQGQTVRPFEEYGQIDWDVPIKVRDGLVLRADVYRPLDDRPVPVLLSYGPYAKGLSFAEGYPDQWRIMTERHPDVTAGTSSRFQNWEVVDPERWVPEGYACVRVDSRGAGRSPGHLDPLSPTETLDLYDCIEWAAEQPWSDGKIGLSGISYYAINQWMVAGLNPPHLEAICVWEGSADWYRDMTHHGGVLSTFWENWFDKQVKVVQYGLGDRAAVNPNTGVSVAGPETLSEDALEKRRASFGADIVAHPLDDDYHRARSAQWEKIKVPMLSAANWGGQGLHPRGNFEGYMRAASEQKWLEVHGLEHWTHYYTDYGVDLQKRFFGHFLKGEDTGWQEQPPVQLQIRQADGSFEQRYEQAWPIPDTVWTKYHLDFGKGTMGTAPAAEPAQIEFDSHSEGVTVLSEPFAEWTEITGPVAARLQVSSSTTDADLFLIMRLFNPEGEEISFQGALDPRTPLAQGWLRLSHRRLDPELTLPYRPYHSHTEREELTPGEVYSADVEVWPTSISIPPGYRIGLTIRGSDFEHDGDSAHLGSFKNPMKGCGPFLHNDPRDRVPEIFNNRMTVHNVLNEETFLLLPVIPSRASNQEP